MARRNPWGDSQRFFSKNALTGPLSLALAWLQGGGGPFSSKKAPPLQLAPLLAREIDFGPRARLRFFSSVALPHAATTLASKGLGAANRLIVACDTLKLRATSACASPVASLCMASRR
jgi:hypothetical protein